jgi:excisionase family DNA binding protein
MRDVEVMMQSQDEILTAEEASELLKVSNKTLLRLARDGALPAQKIGRAWRFCRSELVAYVAQRPDPDERVTA